MLLIWTGQKSGSKPGKHNRTWIHHRQEKERGDKWPRKKDLKNTEQQANDVVVDDDGNNDSCSTTCSTTTTRMDKKCLLHECVKISWMALDLAWNCLFCAAVAWMAIERAWNDDVVRWFQLNLDLHSLLMNLRMMYLIWQMVIVCIGGHC